MVKRIVEHLSRHETRVVASGVARPRPEGLEFPALRRISSDRRKDRLLFNRSWHNRAGVERVMGLCTEEEFEEFMKTVPMFERLLVHCGFTILKYYLDINA